MISALRAPAGPMTFSDVFTAAVLLLLLAVVIRLAVGPTLPARRRRYRGQPLTQLAAGPLVPIAPRSFPGARRTRFLSFATVVLAVLAIALIAMAGVGYFASEMGGLGLAVGIIAATFAFSNWFARRVHVRIDHAGVHGRVMFGEKTIRWQDLAALQLRYLFMPGPGVRMVYYSLRSPTTEIAFPSSMEGAKELRDAIEQATGERWPSPEIEANF